MQELCSLFFGVANYAASAGVRRRFMLATTKTYVKLLNHKSLASGAQRMVRSKSAEQVGEGGGCRLATAGPAFRVFKNRGDRVSHNSAETTARPFSPQPRCADARKQHKEQALQ